jgi:hypothetical protein
MVLASRCLDNLWILSIAGNKEVITSWICFSYSGGANVYTALSCVIKRTLHDGNLHARSACFLLFSRNISNLPLSTMVVKRFVCAGKFQAST